MQKVLILCTGNSCRSILAEAMIDSTFNSVLAYSSGVSHSGNVNINAKKLLQNLGIWSKKYYSKGLKDVENIDFDLVVTVCDSAKESCPIFPKDVKTIHIGFVDPDGQDFPEFQKLWAEMQEKLIPKISKILKLN
ncbi:protein-tyrosine-phosphatase [Thiovulum sp. ES]|nr:protein-tyrosine-phosphatase [Thiovulum sp. ES]